MPRLELLFLEPPRRTLDGAPLSFDRRKATALLAYLAVNPGPAHQQGQATSLRDWLARFLFTGAD